MKGFKYMSKARVTDVSLEGNPGDVRIIGGTPMISNGEMWLPYPETARALIKWAADHGWGFDNGLPARIASDGQVFVRILIGRNPGKNAALGGYLAPGCQFHMTWKMPKKGAKSRKWILGKSYAKTSVVPMWQEIHTIKEIRQMIAQEPVKVPSLYTRIKIVSA